MLFEEERKQNNIEQVTQKVLGNLEPTLTISDVQNIDEDWVFNAYQKASQYSDTDMQELWAKIIAGEIGQQGSFSRRTVNTLFDLDKRQVTYFKTFQIFYF